ncbi:hypothetical protein PAEPH01_1343 [Pancytospora epiphaga]|nr:hypothetical protein PAEPH01_1343 [Pancytospora epiphaga]
MYVAYNTSIIHRLRCLITKGPELTVIDTLLSEVINLFEFNSSSYPSYRLGKVFQGPLAPLSTPNLTVISSESSPWIDSRQYLKEVLLRVSSPSKKYISINL